MKKFKDKRGFTLVETLIVVTIVGILAVVSIPSILQNIDKAKVIKLIVEYDTFKKASINNINLREVNLTDDLINDIKNDVKTVPHETPVGGKYVLKSIENEMVKSLDEEGNILDDIIISWQVALGIEKSDNKISMTRKQFGQLVKTLGNTNIVVKNNGIYIKIVD